MPGGDFIIAVVGLAALLAAAAELIVWLCPRPLKDEMQEIIGDPGTLSGTGYRSAVEPEVSRLRDRGAL